ncbi:glycosyltransferase family 8 protein [Prevotella sp. AGR2160]|uniref:glycosyltransferase family 8 protein n=1 Tax=Prevotella sp. AGR2160 TaxID=1280674 RepID=UPI0018CA629F|nr:glycosyltransferase family 8 protein [Prevotella sp. AGR2160]
MHILLSTDKNYIMPSAVMMKSVSVNHPDTEVVFHVLVDSSVAEEHQRQLESVLVNPKHRVVFHLVDDHLFDDFPMGNIKAYISKATYYRLIITEVIPEDVDKILYLDGDMIVRHDLSDLWNTNLEGYALGAVTDMAEDQHDYQRLGYDRKFGYFNAGMLLINLKYWREHRLKDLFIKLITEEPRRIVLHDQDVLNITLHEHKLNLPMRYNVQNGFLWYREHQQFGSRSIEYADDLKAAVADPYIVHYTSNIKPWHKEDCNPYGYEFLKYYKQTQWRYVPFGTCNKSKLRYYAGRILRGLHLAAPAKTEEGMFLTWEEIENLKHSL